VGGLARDPTNIAVVEVAIGGGGGGHNGPNQRASGRRKGGNGDSR